MKNVDRIIGIDACKIIAMLMICVLHFVGKGGVLQSTDTVVSTVGYLAKSVSIIGVNLFVLCTGYLMCMHESGLRHTINVWTETLFYSMVIGFAVSVFLKEWSISGTIKFLFPVTAMEYWYITSYILLLLFMPSLNQMVNSLSRKQAYSLLLVITLVFSVWKSIFPNNGLLETGYLQGYGIIWMICVYIFGAVLRLYPINVKAGALFVVYLICVFCTFISNYLCRKYSILDNGNKLFDYNHIFIFCASVVLFILFLKINIKNIKIQKAISFVSLHTLAVYVITEQFKFKTIIWKTVAELANADS